MKYMGSKSKHAKDLLPIILSNRKPNQVYVEPFVGGANMMDKVTGDRIGSDVHNYLIKTYTAITNGWIPPKDISEELYKDIQHNKDNYPPELVGYVGFQLSYAGKWFGGYRRDKIGKRNYSIEAYDNMMKQIPKIKDVKFYNNSFRELQIPPNSLIYCDPPYAGATSYKDKFGHADFWKWCDELIEQGHTVFVSEYNAPDGWECVWQKEVTSSLTKETGSKLAIEKLFTKKEN
jgi:DNA adenine methylase